jgi:hypothetical protein
MEILELVEKLPDDIILHIYTKCLKRYRMYNGTLIRLIDFDKYKFLEKYIYRKVTVNSQFNYSNDNNNNDNDIKYTIKYKLPNLTDINRKDSHVDDDMICITFTINDSSVKYEVNRFRLKKICDINIQSRPPNMYYKGDYKDYDWEVLTYTYEI